MNEETRAFIREHREDDIRVLALQGRHPVGVDMPWALEQIAGWQTARRKLPSWAAVEGIVFPPRLSLEQCSSEPTARYKVGIAQRFECTEDAAADLKAIQEWYKKKGVVGRHPEQFVFPDEAGEADL